MNSPLLQSLFDEEERRPLTVSELNAKVRSELERAFSSVWIEGEIANFFEAGSGHWYFTLRDDDSQMKATCFKGRNWRIRFKPFDGLQVRVRGKLSVYEPRGEYQVIIESLEPIGEGALKVAYEQVRARLETEGLFDERHKRRLPFFPERVGVVTSRNGAAFHDILNVLVRRTRSVSVLLIPTLVQGESAPKEIREAILLAGRYNNSVGEGEKIDVLIVGRGGGGAEDLWAFNEERLARTIFESEIPVISAVGHEIDFTIADLVADVRAATPSAAAEIVAEREDDLEVRVLQARRNLAGLIEFTILESRGKLRELALSPVFIDFPRKITSLRERIEGRRELIADILRSGIRRSRERVADVSKRLSPARLSTKLGGRKTRLAVLRQRNAIAMGKHLDGASEKLKIQAASLEALSPLAVLSRGFSITKDGRGRIVRDARRLAVGEKINVRFAEGEVDAKVLAREDR